MFEEVGKKHFFLGAGLLLIALAGAIVLVWQISQKRHQIKESAIVENRSLDELASFEDVDFLENLTFNDLTGSIKKISPSELTLEIFSNNQNENKTTRLFVFDFDPGVRIISFEPVDREKYQKEHQTYRDRLKKDPNLQEMPPKPYAEKGLTIDDLKEGQNISVHFERISPKNSRLKAVEIISR